jgi:primosomal protein N' (replication factor Y)
LLDGVTGSGKTEVYFEGVAECLRQRKQVLIMLPEIALSNAFLTRFQERFGCAPALWHSSLSDGQRKITWRGVASGDCKVVVGARSALFLPYKNIGLIIVDEEHDPAYKQEEGVIYNARDMAVVRAHMARIPVVMVSATPSLETMQNVWAEKYKHLELADRFGAAGMPDVHVVDMTRDKPERNHFIAPSVVSAIQKTIEGQKGQALLVLNRRGYAPLTLCRTCGHRYECPRCTAWLIEHKKTGKLHCHHCGYDTKIPSACTKCGDKDSLVACGPGVERLLEEAKERFPEARISILSSDTATTHQDLRRMLDDIREHRVDIIIGTQIIANGHHFPKLTMVGVIDADLGLSGGDLRASERTFQLLHQVAGRAGREEEKGSVYLQTFNPESRVMKALCSMRRNDFLEVEAMQREAAHMPPYSRLAGIIVSGREEGQVLEASKILGQSSPHGQGIETLGPADAPMYRLRGKYRRRLLVRADKKIDLQKAVEHWLSGTKLPASVRVQVDIDPQSFF